MLDPKTQRIRVNEEVDDLTKQTTIVRFIVTK
jgi:hypothetical protein